MLLCDFMSLFLGGLGIGGKDQPESEGSRDADPGIKSPPEVLRRSWRDDKSGNIRRREGAKCVSRSAESGTVYCVQRRAVQYTAYRLVGDAGTQVQRAHVHSIVPNVCLDMVMGACYRLDGLNMHDCGGG